MSPLFEVERGTPVGMTIEKRADDAAVNGPGERLVMRFGRPLRDQRVPFHKAANAKAFGIGGTATEANVFGRVTLLYALVIHVRVSLPQLGRISWPGKRSLPCSAPSSWPSWVTKRSLRPCSMPPT